MWSGGFSITLDIEPVPSACLPVLVAALAGTAMTAGALVGLAPVWLSVLLTLPLLEAFRIVRRHGVRGTHRLARVRLCPDRGCWAALGSGEQGPAGLRCGWALPAVAVGIELEMAGSGARRSLLLFRDQMDAASWRRLLVFCRQANPAAMT